jgi:hypothetical protein
MYSFTATGMFEIKDRGPVFTIETLPDGIWHPFFLVGEIVEINDQLFKVIATEHFAINSTKEMPYTGSFGLLVKPLTKQYNMIGDKLYPRPITFNRKHTEWLA